MTANLSGMGFRLLHTADWQIGMKAAQVGAAGDRVRAARLEAAQRVIALANDRHVDAVVLAGDTFEDTTVAPRIVQQVVDILRRSSAPVFVLPGNHDPLVPAGPFDNAPWRDAAPGVTVMRAVGPYHVGDADLFGCPLFERTSYLDPLERLPDGPHQRTRIRVGVAHGSVSGGAAPSDQMADDFPLSVVEHVTRAGLDWLALGHWHAPSSYRVGDGVRAAYCGSHEPTKFGERNEQGASGQCLVVSIDEPGAPPIVEAVRTAILDWRQQSQRVENALDVDALRLRIDAEPADSRERVLLDLVLEGLVAVPDRVAIEGLTPLIRERFLFARLNADRVLLRPEDETWISSLPAGSPQAAARALLELAKRDGDDARVARRALDLLFEFNQGAGT